VAEKSKNESAAVPESIDGICWFGAIADNGQCRPKATQPQTLSVFFAFISVLRIVLKRAFRPGWLLPMIRIGRVILQRASLLPASTPNRMASVLENGALL
jgi:hypothetical protein